MKKQELKSIIKECIQSVLKENFMTEDVKDPTRGEMLRFLQQQFGREEGFLDAAEVAMFWFANNYHGGQGSNLYSVLSKSPFIPGRNSRGPEPNSLEADMYQALEAVYGGKEHRHSEEDLLQEAKPKVLKYLDNGFYIISAQQAKEFAVDGKLPRPGYEKKADISKLKGYMGDYNNRIEPLDIDETTTGWILPTRVGDKMVWAIRLYTSPKPMMQGMKEMTTTGAVQGYMTPKAFGKKKKFNENETNDFIEGQSNQVAANRVNKLLSLITKGIHSDNNWEAIRKIFKKLDEAGLNVTITKTQYGGHAETQSGMPKYKEWHISIPFTNNKGKPMELVGVIKAHGAGTIEDPLSSYDITAFVTAMPQRDLQEEEQPEMYDAETDQFAPGPRQRPENWQQGGDTVPQPDTAKIQKALQAIGKMKHHEWRGLMARAIKAHRFHPDDGKYPDRLNLGLALQYLAEHP